MLKNKTFLITGGTGSFANAVLYQFLDSFDPVQPADIARALLELIVSPQLRSDLAQASFSVPSSILGNDAASMRRLNF